jgi:hypothetical protein
MMMAPVLLLLLLGAVLLLRREKAKKALAVPVAAVDLPPALPTPVDTAASVAFPAEARPVDHSGALLVVEVWQLGLFGLGFLLVLAGVAGMVTPLLGLVLVLASVLAVALKARSKTN